MKGLMAYVGGKYQLAPAIISLMPQHSTYIEVFMGAANVYFQKKKSHFNILNDIDGALVNLFRVIRDRHDELIDKIQWTIHSRDEFNHQLTLKDSDDPVKRALSYLYLTKVSYGAKRGTFMPFYHTGKPWNFKSVISKIEYVRNKLQKATIENLDFEKLIDYYDDKDALIYLDPPFSMTKKKGYYTNSFTETDHIRLRDKLAAVKGKFLLSYDIAMQHMYNGFYIHMLPVTYSLGNNDQREEEMLISNYPLSNEQMYMTFDN